MTNNNALMMENKKLKEEVDIYQKGYENILTEKIMLEQEYENYKMAMQESLKEKNQGICGSTTLFNFQSDNIKYKSEIDEYLSTIWELQTNLSLKEEEIRVLKEKNRNLEDDLNLIKKENEKFKKKYESKKDDEEIQKPNENESNNIKNNESLSRIKTIQDLYRSTVIQNTERKIRNKIKQSVNLNIISEKELDKQREEEEEKEREKKEEEFERKRKEEEERQKKLLEEEKVKKELQKKIEEYNNTKKDLENKFQEIKQKTKEYYQDIQNQNIYISNYNNFVNELNEEINKLKDKMNIALFGEKGEEEKDKVNIKITEFTNSLETISGKNAQLSDFIDNSKNVQLKNVENIQTEIQQKINEINNEKNNSNLIEVKNIYETNISFISEKLNELEKILEFLQSNKIAYEKSKKGIEEEKEKLKKEKLKKEITEYVEKVEKSFRILSKMVQGNQNEEPVVDSIFLRGSMLLGIQDFGKVNDIFSSKVLFKKENYDKCQKQDLLRKNWNEVCYVYEEYDIHDVHYELKAVGLPPNSYFTSCSIGFIFDTDVEILAFEIDGKKKKYKYQHYSLEFNIHLKNLQSNKVHFKYKESPSKRKMTEGERRERKFVKSNYYGVTKNIAGENAKFTLSIKCNLEVISFEDEIFAKIKEKEYVWGGKVPPNGKRTLVKMSKTKGTFNFLCSEVIKTRDNQNIKSTKMTVPVSFVGGNNEIVKIDCSSAQTDNVTLKQEERVYEINFLNTNSSKAEFKIEGELINRCKGEWLCDLTDEQIKQNIPEDYEMNKERFKKIAQQIIENYDQNHKNDLIKVPDVVKLENG